MMTIETSDTRTQKALAALPSAGQWLKVRDETGRALAYGVPSATRELVYHFANARQCTCEDARRGNHCWHSRAVAMHIASLKAPRPRFVVSHTNSRGETIHLPAREVITR